MAKRTWHGIEFTFCQAEGMWVSAEGIKLHCARGLRRPLSDHWTVWTGKKCWCSGMTAADALGRFLKK
jgi:hypothetical protein